MAEEMRPLWSQEACEICGREGYASRSLDVPVSIPYVCGDCEMYERGYKEGGAAAQDKIKELNLALAMALSYLRQRLEFEEKYGPLHENVMAEIERVRDPKFK